MTLAIVSKAITLTSFTVLFSALAFSAPFLEQKHSVTATQCAIAEAETRSEILRLQKKYTTSAVPFYRNPRYYHELIVLAKKELKVEDVTTDMSYIGRHDIRQESIIKSHFLMQEMGLNYTGNVLRIPLPIEIQNQFRILKYLAYTLFF